MLKDDERARRIANPEAAQALGIEALAWLAGEPEQLSRFLDLSGLSPHQLRAEAGKPAFFAGLLDFILAHEPTLLDFAAHAGRDPADVAMARRVIGGRGA